MRYLGGKSRIAKSLAAYLESVRDGKRYVEPFLGAAHVLLEMSGDRVGCDIHQDLILMWQAVRDGWVPPERVTEAEYALLKTSAPSPLRGYVGFQGSFGGRWFEGYARDPKSDRNYIKNGLRSIEYARPRLQGVELLNIDYRLGEFTDCLIYCDPPYEGRKQYSGTPKFIHSEFWQWVRMMSMANTVLVSSYQAPQDFQIKWSIETHTDLEMKTGGKEKRTERLYQWNGEL